MFDYAFAAKRKQIADEGAAGLGQKLAKTKWKRLEAKCA